MSRKYATAAAVSAFAAALTVGTMWASAQPAPAMPADAASPAGPQPTGDMPARSAAPVLYRPPSATMPATTQISLNFRDAPIDAVLEHLSDVAGFVVVKDGPVEGRVTVLSKQPVDPAEAVTLLNTVLKENGYTAIQMGRILKVVSIDKAKKLNIPVHFGADPDQIAESDELITQVIPVRSVDAVKLKTDLQPLVGADADLTANGGSNSILITDTSGNIRRIVEIIAAMDKRDATENAIKVHQLKYADATAAAKLITDIFGQSQQQQQGNALQQNPFFRAFGAGAGGRGGGGFGGFGGFGGQGGGFGGPGGGFGGGSGGASAGQQEQGNTGHVTASADTRTNTVVVSGPADTLAVIDNVLTQLDQNPAADQAFFIYKVKNGQAADMQATLNALFGNSSSSSGTTNSSSNRVSSTSGTSNGNRIGSSGSASFGSSGSNSSNSFGTSSISRSFNGGGNTSGGNTGRPGGTSGTSSSTIAAELAGQVTVVADQDTNSLLVATASKYEDEVRNIIAELDRPVQQVLIKVLIAEVTHDNSDDIGTDFSLLNLRASGKGQSIGSVLGNSAAQTTSGGLEISVVENQLTAAFHALATAGKLDVLSRPYILTSDNQEANIVVGQEVPIITDSRLDINNNPVNEITYKDIGIILDVTPHINPDGLVILDVAPEVSSISDTQIPISSTVNATAFNLRSANSRVGIRDGETIVIGGMMQDNKTQTVNKIPILGDIPILNVLFSRNQVSKTKTELLFFLTPHVAPSADRLKPMSDDEMRGVKLVPDAVEPGTFEDHLRGLRRGGVRQPTTGPAAPLEVPPAGPARQGLTPEPALPGGNGGYDRGNSGSPGF